MRVRNWMRLDIRARARAKSAWLRTDQTSGSPPSGRAPEPITLSSHYLVLWSAGDRSTRADPLKGFCDHGHAPTFVHQLAEPDRSNLALIGMSGRVAEAHRTSLIPRST